MAKRPVVLTILDGWGHSTETKGNAVYLAKTPTFDMLHSKFPNTLIYASEEYVGLPKGQMGNSEVGHLNLGAGRILYMDVTRIDLAISNGELFQDPKLLESMAHGRKSRLHLLGLVSDGGVHSHNTHLYALLEMAKREGVGEVYIHAFTDGRDTMPDSGLGFVQELEAKIAEIGVGKIATVSGRYYAMDRDRRWERVEKAFRALVRGEGERAATAVEAVKRSYENKVTDEFLAPTVIAGEGESPRGLIQDGDAVLFFNFRSDRGRELTMALMDPTLDGIDRSLMPKNLHYSTMTVYDKSFSAFGVRPVFEVDTPHNILGAVMEQHNLKNLRTAETEKYPHVTFFFNGGNEKPFSVEDRQMVASPKVATYDLMPEMSAQGVCDVVTKALAGDGFDVIIVNFANPDMVGHTGSLPAAIQACEKVDDCLGQMWPLIQKANAHWIVTADHGNAECMIDPATGKPHTYHTTNPVPLILINDDPKPLRSGGSLRDIAPTILSLAGKEKPVEMTGTDIRML